MIFIIVLYFWIHDVGMGCRCLPRTCWDHPSWHQDPRNGNGTSATRWAVPTAGEGEVCELMEIEIEREKKERERETEKTKTCVHTHITYNYMYIYIYTVIIWKRMDRILKERGTSWYVSHLCALSPKFTPSRLLQMCHHGCSTCHCPNISYSSLINHGHGWLAKPS